MIDEYKMTFKRNLKFFVPIFLYFLIAPLLWVALKLLFDLPNEARLYKGLLICLVGTGIFWLPGILLHLTYYFNDKKKEIRLSSIGVELDTSNVTSLIKYPDISKIELVTAYGWQSPWNNYGFVRITTHDDTVIKFTCLLVDPQSLAQRLSRNSIHQISEKVYGIPYFFL